MATAAKNRKRCYKCKRILSVDGFHKNQSRNDGLDHRCKECKSRYHKEYWGKNRSKLMRQSKEWRKNNSKRDLQYHKEYRENHREELTQCSQEYRSTVLGHLAGVFCNMCHRCNDPKKHNYSRYGGRGIRNKFKSLDNFRDYVINALKIDPRGLQIDRINNNGHYEKGNIRFVTPKENCNNRGGT